jgi:multidrug efflux pump subunit AcrA (membrane-fusion protein)
MLRKWGVRLVIVGAIVVASGIAAGVVPNKRGERSSAAAASTGTDKTRPPVRKEIAVTIQPITARPVQRKVRVVGTLVGREELTVTAKVSGQIVRVNFDLGDEVKPGDVLLEIDDTDYRLAVAEAERNLELELARLGLEDLPPETFDANQLPSVTRAAALLQSTEARFERARKSRASGAISEDEYTLTEADYKVAAANYQQAVLDARTTLAAVRQRKAALDTALQRLADTKVIVPTITDELLRVIGPGGKPILLPPVKRFSVSRRMVSEGEMLQISPTTSMSVFKLVVDDYLKLGALVPERYLAEIQVGQDVDVEVEAHRGQVFRGQIIRMNPTIEPANRTFQILIGVPNPDRRLRAGGFAKAAIYTRIDPAALTVPEEALVSFAGVTKVFVVEEGHAREIQVKPGVRLEVSDNGRTTAWVEIIGDLRAGDAVVTSGQTQLSEGQPVRIRSGM